MIGSILIGFLTALLYCACVILVAFVVVWGCKLMGWAIDGDVYKWGKVVIGLICLIIMITWLLGALGLVSVRPFRITDTIGHYSDRATTQHLQGVLS